MAIRGSPVGRFNRSLTGGGGRGGGRGGGKGREFLKASRKLCENPTLLPGRENLRTRLCENQDYN